MPILELALIRRSIFEDLHIPYFISGSVASSVYDNPRMTNDVDFVADIYLTQLSERLGRFFQSTVMRQRIGRTR